MTTDGDGQTWFDVDGNVHDVPHARNEDVWTSHAAAAVIEDVEGTTTTLRPRTKKHVVLAMIADEPKTACDVVRLDVDRGTSASHLDKRVSDLKNADLIEGVGTRIDPESRRAGIVWAVTERGQRVLDELNRGRTVRLVGEGGLDIEW